MKPKNLDPNKVKSHVCCTGVLVWSNGVYMYPQSNQHHFGGFHAAGYILCKNFVYSVTICDVVKINTL